jgi:hypothetical protein
MDGEVLRLLCFVYQGTTLQAAEKVRTGLGSNTSGAKESA